MHLHTRSPLRLTDASLDITEHYSPQHVYNIRICRRGLNARIPHFRCTEREFKAHRQGTLAPTTP